MKLLNHHSLYSGLNPNVSDSERIISTLAGSLAIYRATQKKQAFPEILVGSYLLFRGVTGFCGIYNAIGKTKPDNRSRNVNIQVSLEVDRPREEVYNFWRQLENLPLFMEHLEMVNSIDEKTSVWEAKIPGGIGNLRWRSEIVKERPFELLGWQSLPGSEVENAGKVEFRDTENGGTELHVVITYHAPMGIAGEGVARMINPYFRKVVENDIRNFKTYIEKQHSAAGGMKSSPGKFLV